MNIDPIAQFKSKQRETWTMGNFGDMAVFTTPVAGYEDIAWHEGDAEVLPVPMPASMSC